MKIIQTPDDVLTSKAKPVKKFDQKLKDLIKNMKTTLKQAKNPEGVGLAAPQIGVSKRLFIMRPDIKNNPDNILVCINPEILESKSNDTSGGSILEGCLSIDNTWGFPDREEKIKIKYQNQQGNTRQKKFKGFPAVIIQHEIDHLNGILFTHRVVQQEKDLYKIEENQQGKTSLTPINL